MQLGQRIKIDQNAESTYKCLVRHKRSCCEVGSTEQTDATPLVPEHQLLTWTNQSEQNTYICGYISIVAMLSDAEFPAAPFASLHFLELD
jgi:hypothetical protein